MSEGFEAEPAGWREPKAGRGRQGRGTGKGGSPRAGTGSAGWLGPRGTSAPRAAVAAASVPSLVLGLVLTLAVPVAVAAAEPAGEPLVVGQRYGLTSRVLQEERPVEVALPASYDTSPGSRYPVLIVLDGETHFQQSAALVRYLSRNGAIPEMIVVGLANTNRDRDMTPVHLDGPRDSGGGPAFVAFLGDELVPWLESRYRTQPFRVLFGHSATGNLGIWALSERPGLLSAVVAASPWLIWNDDWAVRTAAERWKARPPQARFLYFTTGDEPELVPTVERFTSFLESAAPAALDWSYRPMAGHDHSSLAPQTWVDGLRHVFRHWPPGAEVTDLEAARCHYAGLTRRYGYPVAVPERVVNLIGYRHLAADRVDEALAAFRSNVEAHPLSANVHDSLGDALTAAGELEAAVASHARAVELGRRNGDPFLPAYERNLEAARQRLEEQGGDG